MKCAAGTMCMRFVLWELSNDTGWSHVPPGCRRSSLKTSSEHAHPLIKPLTQSNTLQPSASRIHFVWHGSGLCSNPNLSVSSLPSMAQDAEMSDLGSAQTLLERTKLVDICKSQQIVLLEHNQTVGDALKTLARNQILSAPMVSGRRGLRLAPPLPSAH